MEFGFYCTRYEEDLVIVFADGDAFLQRRGGNAITDESGKQADRTSELGERDLGVAASGAQHRRPVMRYQSVPIDDTAGAPVRLRASRKRSSVDGRRLADDLELADGFVHAIFLHPAR